MKEPSFVILVLSNFSAHPHEDLGPLQVCGECLQDALPNSVASIKRLDETIPFENHIGSGVGPCPRAAAEAGLAMKDILKSLQVFRLSHAD